MNSETVEGLIDRLLEYREGHLYWKKNTRRGHKSSGGQAGYKTKQGYRMICLNYKDYCEHNLVWFIHKREWPETYSREVDHINRDKSDNRIENLRLATRSQNNANMKIRIDNSTGVRGVYLDRARNKFCVQITQNGRTQSLGRFNSLEDAAEIAELAQKKAWGNFVSAT